MKHFARRLKVKDNINTDYVISGRYKFKIQDPKELAKYIFEDLDPDFAARVKKALGLPVWSKVARTLPDGVMAAHGPLEA